MYRIFAVFLIPAITLGCLLFEPGPLPQRFTPTPSRTALPTATTTATPSPPPPPPDPQGQLHSEGVDAVIPWGGSFDLDAGQVFSQISGPGADFGIKPGKAEPDGTQKTVRLLPVEQAVFGYHGAYDSAPLMVQCTNTPAWSSNAWNITPAGKYLCFRTPEERYGFIYFKEIHPLLGITIDWRTWEKPSAFLSLPEGVYAAFDNAVYLQDVTAPDGSIFAPGEAFTKIWRLQNGGTTTWTPDYSLVLQRGDPMGAFDIIPLGLTVRPGQEENIAIKLTAPQSLGVYTGYWMLRSDIGVDFGLGAQSSEPFYVNIIVGESGSTSTPAGAVIRSQGTSPFIPANSCFDLDEGKAYTETDPTCDFTVYMGPTNDNKSIDFAPNYPARFTTGALLRAQPSLVQCLSTIDYSVKRDSIAPQGFYACYKTNLGRFGSMLFKYVNNGVTISWETYQ